MKNYRPSKTIWDHNYVFVYHMAQDPTGAGACILDSTDNSNHATPYGSFSSASLIDGKSISFNGTDNELRIELANDVIDGTLEIIAEGTSGTLFGTYVSTTENYFYQTILSPTELGLANYRDGQLGVLSDYDLTQPSFTVSTIKRNTIIEPPPTEPPVVGGDILAITIPQRAEELVDFPFLLNLGTSTGITDVDCEEILEVLKPLEEDELPDVEPIAHFKFEDISSGIIDEKGTYTGTIVGTLDLIESKFNQGLSGSVSANRVDFASSIQFKTLSVWVKRHTADGVDIICCDTAPTAIFFIDSGAVGNVKCFSSVYGNNIYNHTIKDFEWHHLVFVEGTTVDKHFCWLDGVKSSDELQSNFNVNGIDHLGRVDGGQNIVNLDNIQVFDVQLTESQILELYNAPNPAYEKIVVRTDTNENCYVEVENWSSGYDEHTVFLLNSDNIDGSDNFWDKTKRHTLTVNGGVHHEADQKKLGTTSAAFLGGTDHLSIPDSGDWNFENGDYTVDFWVYVSAIHDNAGIAYIGDQNAGTNYVFYIHFGASDELRYGHYSATNGSTVVDAGVLSKDVWHHVAFCKEGLNLYFFVDGILVDSNTCDGTTHNVDNPLVIGHYWSTGYSFNGYLDEFRISKGIARWTSDFTPPTARYQREWEAQLWIKAPSLSSTEDTVLSLSYDPDNDDNTTLSSEPLHLFSCNEGTTDTEDIVTQGKIEFFNGTNVATGGKFSYCMSLPAVSDYAEFTPKKPLELSGDYTIEYWYKEPSAGNRTVFNLPGSVIGSQVYNNNVYLYIDGSYNAVSAPHTADTWYHHAIVRVGSNVTFYVNGVAKVVRTQTTHISAAQIFFNGNHANAGFSLDEIAIYDHAKYTGDFTPPIEPSLFTCGFIGPTGSPAATRVWDDSFVIVCHMAQNPGPNDAEILDSTSHSNHGTPHMSMTDENLVDGQSGKAIIFDGNDDFIDFGYDTVHNIIDTLTLESSFSTPGVLDSSATEYTGLIDRIQFPASDQDSYTLLINPDGLLHFGTQGGNLQSTKSSWEANTFFNVAGTYNSSGLMGDLFIDGNKETLLVDNFNTMAGCTNHITVGMYHHAPLDYSNITIDEFRISNIVRSDEWLNTTVLSHTDSLISLEFITSTQQVLQKKIKLTIPVQLTELINFPLRLNLSSASGTEQFDCSPIFDNLTSSTSKKLKIETHEGDVCFTEIVEWNGTNADLCVKVPQINGYLDTYTKFFIRSEHTDGSTAIVDSSFNPHLISRVGEVHHEHDQAKFGNSSLHFDGGNDYLNVPDSEDWNIMGGDFTIDFWIYNQCTTYAGVVVHEEDYDDKMWGIRVGSTGTALYFTVNGYPGGGGGISWGTALTSDVWQHVAVVCEGNRLSTYIDGVLTAERTDFDPGSADFSSVLRVGSYHAVNTSYNFKGYLEEFRISKGIARWTSNFTPPTDLYEDSAPTILYLDYDPSNSDNDFIGDTTEEPSGFVINLPTSSEGTIDTTRVAPITILKESDNSYKMWYTCSAGAGYQGAYCTSSDGINWSDFRSVLSLGAQGTYDTGHSWAGFVVKESDTSYKMWYSGHDGTNWRILYCTSTDGLTWSNFQLNLNIGSQGTHDTSGAYSPYIIKESDTSYKMWYSGLGSGNTTWRIIYCTSSDGINWSNFQVVVDINSEGVYDTTNAVSSCILKESDTSYKIWYAGKDSSNYRIIEATSNDGINWSNFRLSVDVNSEGSTDSLNAYYPLVLKESDGLYKLWYSGHNGTLIQGVYCTSTDATNWGISTPASSVWGENFAATYHTNQDPSLGVACILDSTSNRFHGTPHNSMTSNDLVELSTSKGLELDGADDFIDVPNLAPSFSTGEPSCFQITFQITGTLTADIHGNVILSAHTSTGSNRVRIGIDGVTKGVYIATHDDSDNSSNDQSFGSGLDDGEVHELVVLVTGDGSKTVYVDQELLTSSYTPMVIGWNTVDTFSIGQEYDGGATSDFFPGIVSEIRIYRNLLSLDWIQTNKLSVDDGLIAFEEIYEEGTPPVVDEKKFTLTLPAQPSELVNFPILVNLATLRQIDGVTGDDFTGDDGNHLDDLLWEVLETGDSTCRIDDNRLAISIDSAGSNCNPVSTFDISGDLDVQVDFDVTGTPFGNTWASGLQVHIPSTGDLVQVLIMTSSSNRTYDIARYVGGTWTTIATSTTSDLVGSLRITRTGSIFTFYYDNGGSWTQAGTYNYESAPDVTSRLPVSSWGDSPGPFTTWFDGFVINSGTVVWSDKVSNGSGLDSFDCGEIFDELTPPAIQTTQTWLANNSHGDPVGLEDDDLATYVQGFSYCCGDFGSPFKLTRFRAAVHNNTAYLATSACTLQGSNDTTNGNDGSWKTLISFRHEFDVHEPTTYPGWACDIALEHTESYQFYRLTGNGSINIVFNNWELYDEGDLHRINIQDEEGNKCLCEIERWDSIKKSAQLWVQVPTISASTNTIIELFYDKTQDSNSTRPLVNEDFTGDDDTQPNPLIWEFVNGEHSSIKNNTLALIKTDTNPGSSSGYRSRYNLVGDFDIEIDFGVNSSVNPSNEHRLGLLLTSIYHTIYLFWNTGAGGGPYYRYYFYEEANVHADSAYVSHSQTAGKLRITRTDNLITLYYWSGTEWVWDGNTSGHQRTIPYPPQTFTVQLQLYAGDQPIDAYLDNFTINSVDHLTGYIGRTGSTPALKVWDTGYVGVYHLSHDPSSTSLLLDSTYRPKAPSSYGTMTSGNQHKSNHGTYIDYDGIDDHTLIDLGSNRLTGTVEIIVKAQEDVAAYDGIFSAYTVITNYATAIIVSSDLHLGLYLGSGTQTPTIPLADWTADYNNISLTIDPVGYDLTLHNTGGNINAAQTDLFLHTDSCLSRWYQDTRRFPGLMRELRISSIVRTADWREASYLSNMDQLITFSEPVVVDPPNVIPDPLIDGWDGSKQLEVTIPASEIPEDFENVAVLLRLSNSTGPDSLDMTEMFDDLGIDGANDTFEGTSGTADSSRWTVSLNAGVPEPTLVNNEIVLDDASSNTGNAFLHPKYDLLTDFDVRVDCVRHLTTGGSILMICGRHYMIFRSDAFNALGYNSSFGTVYDTSVALVRTTAALRMTRVGTVYTLSYDPGGGWVILSIHDDSTNAMSGNGKSPFLRFSKNETSAYKCAFKNWEVASGTVSCRPNPKLAVAFNGTSEQCFVEMNDWRNKLEARKYSMIFERAFGSSQNGNTGLTVVGSPLDNTDFYTFNGSTDGLRNSAGIGDSSTEVCWARVRIHNKNKGTAQVIWKDGGSTHGISVGIHTNGHLGIYGTNNSTLVGFGIPPEEYENDVWYDIFFTRTKVTIIDKETSKVVAYAYGMCITTDGSDYESVGCAHDQSPMTGTDFNEASSEFFDGDLANLEVYTSGNLSGNEDPSVDLWVLAPTISSTEDTLLTLHWDPTHDDNDFETAEDITFDGIDGDLLPTKDWRVSHYDGSPTLDIQNNKLRWTGISGVLDKTVVNGLFYMSGDFDITIDMDIDINLNGAHTYGLFRVYMGNDYIQIGCASSASQSFLFADNHGTWTSYSKTLTTTKLRVTRVGTTVKGYIWDNNRWEWNGSTSGITSAATPDGDLRFGFYFTATDATTAIYDFDNLIINGLPRTLNVGITGSMVAKNVWDTNYRSVYHFSDDPASTLIDSRAFSDGSPTLFNTDHILEHGYLLDGTNFHTVSYLENQSNLTMRAFCKPTVEHQIDSESSSATGGVSGQKYLLGPQNGVDTYVGVGMSVGTNGITVYEHSNSHMPPTAVYVAAIDKTFISVTRDNVDRIARIYDGGILLHTGVPGQDRNMCSFNTIGTEHIYGQFEGEVYEVRLASKILTPEYMSISEKILRDELVTYERLASETPVEDPEDPISNAYTIIFNPITGESTEMAGESIISKDLSIGDSVNQPNLTGIVHEVRLSSNIRSANHQQLSYKSLFDKLVKYTSE